MGKDKKFDGSYETSRYADRSLEEDIKHLAEDGVLTKETSTGGLYKETPTRIDVWEKGTPGDYNHHYYNSETGEHGKK